MALLIRKPAAAGKFYDSDPEKLRKAVRSYMRPAGGAKEKILGVLVPHAGYVFSGATAGAAFASLKGADIDTAVVIGTGHTEAVRGAAIMSGGFFETPLGRLEIDGDLARALLAPPGPFKDLPSAHAGEHSVEVELPFLQELGIKKFLPVTANSSEIKVLEEAGRRLGAALRGRKAVICVSSDLSHYPPADLAERSDPALLLAYRTAFRNGDMAYFALANELLLEKAAGKMDTAACGFAAMVLGAAACAELGADDFRLLEYTHSGKISGDASGVVGYAAGLFTGGGERPAGELDPKLKKELLALARSSIESKLKKIPAPSTELLPAPELNQPAAVFVTLNKGGALRGCIGTMTPRQLLADAVVYFAEAAAFSDTRFAPVSAGELRDIKMEISVLSPLRRVESWTAVEQGKHGVYVRKGRLSGTYLPQVWEHFGSREEFLTSLCLEKAGLPAGAWKEKSTELFVYSVDSFEEK